MAGLSFLRSVFAIFIMGDLGIVPDSPVKPDTYEAGTSWIGSIGGLGRPRHGTMMADDRLFTA